MKGVCTGSCQERRVGLPCNPDDLFSLDFLMIMCNGVYIFFLFFFITFSYFYAWLRFV